MNLIVVGTNHKYSQIEIREKLFFSKKRLKEALRILSGFGGINAAVILSTCNRVELYIDAVDADRGVNILKDFLSDYHQQELFKIEPYLYTYIGKEAIRHLFCVASGLDSQILGESQISEQVRFAYEEAKETGTTNEFLTRTFTKAINTAILVRNSTEISKGNVSIASIAIELIKDKFVSLKSKKILIIGIGRISELVMKELRQENIEVTFIANRNYEKAAGLAKQINARVVRFDELKERLKDTDIIISATSSPHLILKKVDLIEIKKPLLIIDLAVPRDVDPQVKYIKGVSLFCLDDFDLIIDNNLQNIRQNIPEAEEIINKEVENLCLAERLELEPAIAPLP